MHKPAKPGPNCRKRIRDCPPTSLGIAFNYTLSAVRRDARTGDSRGGLRCADKFDNQIDNTATGHRCGSRCCSFRLIVEVSSRSNRLTMLCMQLQGQLIVDQRGGQVHLPTQQNTRGCPFCLCHDKQCKKGVVVLPSSCCLWLPVMVCHMSWV